MYPEGNNTLEVKTYLAFSLVVDVLKSTLECPTGQRGPLMCYFTAICI